MFTLTDSASRLQISALDRASPSEMQTHQECPPRRITPLEYALTKNSACKSFRIRTYNFIGLKARGMNTYKKEGGWGVPLARRARPLGATNVHCGAPGLIPLVPPRRSRREQMLDCCQVRRRTVPPPGGAMPGSLNRKLVTCMNFDWNPNLSNWDSTQQLLRLTWSLCAPRMADSSMNVHGDNRAESHRGPTMRRPCAVLGDTFPVEMRRR